MNIAVSPDPALLSAPEQIPGILTGLPNGFTEIPFADLLGMPPESSPEEGPRQRNPAATPRKQATDMSNPALIASLPFLAQQIPQTPALPPPAEGETFGTTTEAPTTSSQSGSVISAEAKHREPLIAPPQWSDKSAGAGLSLTLAVERQDQILQMGLGNAFAMGAEHAESSAAAATLPGDSLPEPLEQSPQSINDPVQSPFRPRVLASAFQQGSDSAVLSAPEANTTPALLPGTNPPADFSSAAGPVANPTTMPTNGVSAGNQSTQTPAEKNSGQNAAREADGTTAAMHLRAMPEQFTERTLKAKPDGPATSSVTVQNRAATAPAIPTRNGLERRIEPEATAETKTPIRTDAVVEKGHPLPAPVNTSGDITASTEADVTAAARITRQTMDLTEHVRAMGRDHVEVQMRLRDGEEVTVSLRLEKGEWKPVFKTDSEALCRALEQNWNRTVAQPSAQAVRYGTPVFESQQTQTNGGQGGHPGGHQQSDARDRSFNRREQEPAFAIPARPVRTTATTPTPTRTPVAPTAQIYA